MTATTLVLVRHGETDWNRDRRVQGHTDVPLNETGRAQAEELAATVRNETFAAVYASDLSRAVETAQIVTAADVVVISLAALRERHFGTWEGLTNTQVLARHPEAAGAQWGDGETTEEMGARVLGAVADIHRTHPAATVLVVTHGGPMRAILRACNESDEPIANCRALRVVAENGSLRRVD